MLFRGKSPTLHLQHEDIERVLSLLCTVCGVQQTSCEGLTKEEFSTLLENLEKKAAAQKKTLKR
ncbi:hypothetical protein [Chitinivibrio alkaliphilus]|uniref:Uncharacterized protein n=1 Tax=Chitinivibrio alkaliphilus ACht1 TaxID=1313304 RepID=U7D8G2_9BACT|nr:hypothetical protein [Chitinivibrio alkaliphilus]ERP31831.1 hypothetical protein CALK_1278 [Chitinivibrio alkaliphilus ACht1]